MSKCQVSQMACRLFSSCFSCVKTMNVRIGYVSINYHETTVNIILPMVFNLFCRTILRTMIFRPVALSKVVDPVTG